MPYNIILYFRLPYFHVSNSALFSTYYFSTLILYRCSLDTFSHVDGLVQDSALAMELMAFLH